MKRFVDAIDSVLAAAVSTLLVLLFFVMLCLSAVQIGMRYFLQSGVPWADVAARNLLSGSAFWVLSLRPDKASTSVIVRS
jgi:TRAP-type C4-dicarboxylate transport system permease small subunit